MTRASVTALSVCWALAVGTPAIAQDLSEVCPGAEDDTGALLGVLFDADSEVALPGATVVARWTIDGAEGRAETGTSIDGSFTLCQVPLETEITLLGMIGTVPGQAVAITLTDPVTRQDVAISLAGSMGGGGEKMLACLGPPDSEFRLRVGEFVHCDPGGRDWSAAPGRSWAGSASPSPALPAGGRGSRERRSSA